MQNKQKRYNDMIDASVYAWKTLTEEQRKERARLIHLRERYKKMSAMLFGATFGMSISGEPFWAVVIYAIIAVSLVSVFWLHIDRWGTARLGSDG